MHEKYVRDLLFADDAAITTHTQEDLQRLLDRFSDACRHFGLTISLAKTQVMGQDIKEIPSLFIHNYKLEVVHEFVYLGSTITDNLSIDSELNKRIGKAAMTLSRLTKRVWSNNKLSDHTWDTKLVHSLKAKAHAMAGTCDTDEKWPHSKRPFIWRTGDRKKTNRTTSSGPKYYASKTYASETSKHETSKHLA